VSTLTVLAFERDGEACNGRRVRRACFERRSSLPVSAACVVANGVRETLGALLATPVSLRLLEPMIPGPAAWDAICGGAQLFGMRGPLCDAAFVLRPQDALALATSAFGERPDAPRPLSAVEQEVLARALRGVAGSVAPVCGRELSPLERILDIRGYVTYFELLVERPVQARIGVALSRDPAARGAPTLRIEDLLDVQVELSVEFARGTMPAAAFLDLRHGANVPMTTRIGEPGRLKLGGAVLAHGECGAMGERNAMIVTTVR
jgi:flagellar motor switch/type III secretory pathway protein FliN